MPDFQQQSDNNIIAGSQTELEPIKLSDECFEIEVNEDDIAYYIVDDKDREIGFALREGEEEVEYYYAEIESDAYEVSNASDEDIAKGGITKNQIKNSVQNIGGVVKDGVAVAGELKDTYDDVKNALGISEWKKVKERFK